MDSSSSGSMQSSGGGGGGGGDEEFDSRSDSTFSAFLNSSTISNQHPPPQGLSSQYQNHPSPLFDSLTSNYFDIFSQSAPPATPNSLLNLDMVLSRGSTSATSTGGVGGVGVGGGLLFSSAANTQQQQPPPPPLLRIPNQTSLPSSSNHETNSRVPPADPGNNNNNVGVRNPKKRTRASRRAPTTVLTTDTSNFRAMVQEFTGIPPPPFAPSPFLGNRLNLFNSSSSSLRSSLESSLPYPLRPFAHKVLPPSFLTSMISSSNSSTSTTSTTIKPNSNNSSNNNPYNPASSNSFNLLSELGLSRQSESLTDMQHQHQNNLQSHHHQQQQLQLSSNNQTFFGAKSQNSLVLDEFSLGHHGQINSDELGGNAGKSLNDEWVQH